MTYVRRREPGGVGMYLHPLTWPRPPRHRSHLDLTVPWASRRELVDRLLGHGATHVRDVVDGHPAVQWTVLPDTGGNQFCVAEHPPR